MDFKERKRWPLFGLPFTFTTYTVKEDLVTIDEGFLNRKENDCYINKIQDGTRKARLADSISGLGTVVCSTGDTTHPKLELLHIKNARTIKDFILEQAEEQRMKRRTLNTQDIGADRYDDPDDAAFED